MNEAERKTLVNVHTALGKIRSELGSLETSRRDGPTWIPYRLSCVYWRQVKQLLDAPVQDAATVE